MSVLHICLAILLCIAAALGNTEIVNVKATHNPNFSLAKATVGYIHHIIFDNRTTETSKLQVYSITFSERDPSVYSSC